MIDDNTFDALPPEEALERLGIMIDEAADTKDAALNHRALELCQRLHSRANLPGNIAALGHYFKANAFDNQLAFEGTRREWAWDVSHLENELFELRRAVKHRAFVDLDPVRRCQILTNLANKFHSVGRPVEAVAYWDRAVSIIPQFGMALGNRGHGLVHYSNALYDDGHAGVFLADAHESFSHAAADTAFFESDEGRGYQPRFLASSKWIEDRIDVAGSLEDLHRQFDLGSSSEERAYRSWCLSNRLFLNPLNDLGNHSIAANDVLHLPSVTTSVEYGPEPPALFGFYNQLKQEFVSARWLAYEGLTEEHGHFSDRDTHLYDTLGVPSYSLGTEKTKLAFRMAYSLFDKIAFFLNDYLAVGVEERNVSFRGIWFGGKRGSKILAPIFVDRENWALRGLYWLSKDLYEATFKEVAEPDAEGFSELRNHLEHKYCQVFQDVGLGYGRVATSLNGSILGFQIERQTLDARCLHILKLSRAALIYLSLSVHREEEVRRSERPKRLSMPMPLWIWKERGRL
ncbi:hypothetical protein HFN06_31830 [Rhizobium leguminosarum]|uniref:LA2681 family HEPN domain-containing protein n=1 Tax=Rhizobium leguminosarum TaxID=384 RepID=UPI001C93AA5D|nr:LA2681 family HEPN domain-containing protein [Rhizobium leguminosarum]MBY5386049.1 hypothetical protein [Rhizobium leguminosarum]MCA2436003.1 hypothetical protein [Rhizobium leguminosarum]